MIDDVLAAKDWRCSASFSLQIQQRLSWPPVATMDEPSAMQLMGAGEATHSCWRAAIVLLWGCFAAHVSSRDRCVAGQPPRNGGVAALLELNSSSRGPAFAGMRGVRGAAWAAARFECCSGLDAQTKMKMLVCPYDARSKQARLRDFHCLHGALDAQSHT